MSRVCFCIEDIRSRHSTHHVSVHNHHRCRLLCMLRIVLNVRQLCFWPLFSPYPSFFIYIASIVLLHQGIFSISSSILSRHMLNAVFLSNHFQWILYSRRSNQLSSSKKRIQQHTHVQKHTQKEQHLYFNQSKTNTIYYTKLCTSPKMWIFFPKKQLFQTKHTGLFTHHSKQFQF